MDMESPKTTGLHHGPSQAYAMGQAISGSVESWWEMSLGRKVSSNVQNKTMEELQSVDLLFPAGPRGTLSQWK